MLIKVLTLNIWNGGRLMDAAIDFLKKEDADIVCLQEVYNGEDSALKQRFRTMQMLDKKLNYTYKAFAAAYLEIDETNGQCQSGNAILSKLPIVKTEAVFLGSKYSETYRDIEGNFQNCPRILQRAVLETKSGEVNVFNIHGVWDLDGDNYSEDRKIMAEEVIKNIKGKPNTILAGDTNARASNKAIEDIEAHVHNVFGQELKTTFNMRRKSNPGYADSCVDMIFVDKKIEIIDRQCPDVDISDHLPLIALVKVG